MDRNTFFSGIRYGQTLFGRAPAVSSDHPKGPSPIRKFWIVHSRQISALGLVAMSIGLGNWAYQGTWESAFQNGRSSDVPSREFWSQSLRSLGFVAGKEEVLPRLLRTLPVQAMEQVESVWFAVEGEWIAIPLGGENTGMGFYSRASNVNQKKVATPLEPAAWRSLGTGWDAVKSLMGQLAVAPTKVSHVAPQKPRGWVDRRALRY